MAGLDSIKGYNDGGEIDTTQSTPTEPAPVAVKPTVSKAGKYNLPQFSGATLVTDSGAGEESVLEQMKRLIEERKAQQGSFLERLRDAQAWWSPTEQRSQALQNRATERENQRAEIFNMQQSLAQFKAQQQQAMRKRDTLTNLIGGGDQQPEGLVGGAPVSGPGTTAPMDPTVRSSIKAAMDNGDIAGAEKIYNDWAKTVGTESVKSFYSQDRNKLVDVSINGETRQVPQWWINQNPQVFVPESGNKVVGPAAGGVSGKTDISPANIEQVESRGRAGAIGPEVPGQGRAKGSMQVMDATADNPGFGVKPANITGDATNDEAERKRVGTEYFNKMKERYKDPSLAAAAYVWGPGNLDNWIKGGAELSKLPKEVRDYVGQAAISGATFGRPNELAAPRQEKQTSTATNQPLRATSKEQAAALGEARTATAKGLAESGVKMAEGWQQSASSADEKINTANGIINIATQSPQALGVLNKPGMQNALGIILKEGIKLGSIGQVGLPVIEDAMRRSMPNVSKQDIDNINELKGYLGRLELEFSKTFLQGQGAVSDNERRIVSNLGGSISDSAETLKKKATLVSMRAEYDKQINAAWGRYRDQYGEYVEPSRFQRSPEFQRIKDDYNKKLAATTIFAKDIKEGENKAYPTSTWASGAASGKKEVPQDIQDIIKKHTKKGL